MELRIKEKKELLIEGKCKDIRSPDFPPYPIWADGHFYPTQGTPDLIWAADNKVRNATEYKVFKSMYQTVRTQSFPCPYHQIPGIFAMKLCTLPTR